jgi:hypothetical protein
LVASNRTVEPVSRKPVQQFNEKIELLGFSQRGLKILRVLGTPDCTASDAAKVVGCSKSLVSCWKDHAIKVGALRLQADLSEAKVKTILRSSLPTKRGDIESIASKMADIPDQERWFIQVDELINFPRILKTGYNYFFLDEGT